MCQLKWAGLLASLRTRPLDSGASASYHAWVNSTRPYWPWPVDQLPSKPSSESWRRPTSLQSFAIWRATSTDRLVSVRKTL